MALRVAINYAPGSHTGACIESSTNPLKHGIAWKKTRFGEKGEVDLVVDINFSDNDEPIALASLLWTLNPCTLQAVEAAIEAAFLAGVEYTKKNRKIKQK